MTTMYQHITIVGYGHVGYHMHQRLVALGCIVDQIWMRTQRPLAQQGPRVVHEATDLLPTSDLYLLCVSDDAITQIADTLSLYLPPSSPIAHTSGTRGMEALGAYWQHPMILYPLMTIHKADPMDWQDTPLLITAQNQRDLNRLQILADRMSPIVHRMSDSDRAEIHLAATVSSNFLNALYTAMEDRLRTSGLDVRILLPLLRASLRKLDYMEGRSAQTGAAARGDTSTLAQHREQLAEDPKLLAIYNILTELIIEQQSKK